MQIGFVLTPYKTLTKDLPLGIALHLMNAVDAKLQRLLNIIYVFSQQ